MLKLRPFLASSTAAVSAELSSIARMGSASLREAAESISNEPDFEIRKKYISAISKRSLEIQHDMKHWDVIAIVQSIALHGSEKSGSDSIEKISKIIESKLSHFSPKHLIDTIAAFETVGYRNKALYVECLNRLLLLANSSMYVDELVALLRTLAIHKLDNRDLLTGLSKAILTNQSVHGQVRFLHCCEIAGSLATLNFMPKKLEIFLLEKSKSEIDLMPVDEVWKSMTGLKTKLACSYKPLEDMLESKFVSICQSKEFADLLDQVSAPMDMFQFIRMRGMLTDEILIRTCKWANNAVYRPATRVNESRRPTVFEVALLADLCVERGISVDEIAKAVKITVATEGGTSLRVPKPKPLKYRRRRVYLRKSDPYEELKVVPVKAPVLLASTSVLKSNNAAFAPKLRTSVPLWKSRSNAWYFRK
jgi:hypothetical protein